MRQPYRRFARDLWFVQSICLVVSIFFLCGFDFLAKIKNEEANKLYKKGQVNKAKAAYQSARKDGPKIPEIAYNLGNANFKENSYKESLENYRQAAQDPKDPLLQSKAFYNLGNALYRQKDLEKASEFYKQALRLNPKDEDAKFNLEKIQKEQEKKQDKDQDKKDQNKQDQKDQQKSDSKDSQGSQGGQGSQDQNKESSAGEGQNQTGEDQKDEHGDGQEQKQDQAPGDQENKQGSGSKPQESDQDQPQPSQASAGDTQEGSSGEEPKKSEAQARAEQLLNALENQEQQALKLQSGINNPKPRIRRVSEKDW